MVITKESDIYGIGILGFILNNNNNMIRVLLFQDCSSTNLCKNKNLNKKGQRGSSHVASHPMK